MGYGTHKVQSQEKEEGMSNIFTGSEELRGPGDKREFSWVWIDKAFWKTKASKQGWCGNMKGANAKKGGFLWYVVPYTRVEVQS